MPKIFRRFEVRKNIALMFWRPKDIMEGKCYVFSGHKQRNKVCLVYLECKLKQDRYRWSTFKLKCQKTVERTYLETSKLQRRHRWCFQTLKFLRKGNNSIIGLSQKTNRIHCMYLALNNLKKTSKKGQLWEEREKQSMNDVFRG